MKKLQIVQSIALALFAGCAATVPAELRDARQAYSNATKGPAAKLTPVELHKALVALQAAEQSWQADPESFRTLDLAYVAQRKAQGYKFR